MEKSMMIPSTPRPISRGERRLGFCVCRPSLLAATWACTGDRSRARHETKRLASALRKYQGNSRGCGEAVVGDADGHKRESGFL